MSTPDQDGTARIDSGVRLTPRGPQPQFAPGTAVAGRYRIAGILGSGGMGEVYRADDTKLDQAVALKFLPARLSRDPILLARLHDEVRLGRQISHPNVCRIYDIVDWEGAQFVAMEYVDGEDLARLLKRIGRLAHDKAVDIARGIAAGLMAAHAKGILHRDLKPANIMIDSHGDARIMDFGLALAAGEDDGTISGTPAYMAPEQLEGRPATIQSDLYALGLVMYELFTGKRALSARTMPERLRDISSEIATPSSVIRDLDPAVERVILRCLSSDPMQRPRSAREVIEALPGGDPLAAAMAAGETPSPGMVAAAGTEGSLRPALAWTALAAVLLLLGAMIGWRYRDSLLTRYPIEKRPEVLADRAAAILREAGIPPQPYETSDLKTNEAYIAWVGEMKDPNRWDHLAGGPAAVQFTLQQRAAPATPLEPDVIGATPGATEVVLSPRGELVSLVAAPAPQWSARPLDWKPLFAAAGLDASHLKPATPQFVPPTAADTRAAWTGHYPSTRTPLRVEAAAWRGTPVLFRVTGPWDDAGKTLIEKQEFAGPGVRVALAVLAVAVFAFATLLAWRNLRLRRGDRQGALRVAAAVFVLTFLTRLAEADHQLDGGHALALLQLAIAHGLFWSLLTYLTYIALEPFIRRRWPSAIISWTRLLAGRTRDPMIGRDVLVGCVAGLAHTAISTFTWPVLAGIRGDAPSPDTTGQLGVLNGVRFSAAYLTDAFGSSVIFGFVVLVILTGITMLVRHRGAAVVILTLTFMGVHGAAVGNLAGALLASVPLAVILIVTLIRFGLVGFVAAQFVFLCTFHYPLPVAITWWTGLGLIGPAAVIALAAWGFKTSLAGRNPFGETAFAD